MYEIESGLYQRRKELQGQLLRQFSHDNKVFLLLYSVVVVVMEYANLAWRDWLSGHCMLLIVITGYLSAQRWVGKNGDHEQKRTGKKNIRHRIYQR